MKKIFIIAVLSLTMVVPFNNSSTHAASLNGGQKECHFHTRNVIREKTPSADILPHFMDDQPEHVKKIYLNAAKNKKLLSYIPCYCGCGESAGHMDTYQCFIFKDLTDGSVVWDNHAAKCGICLDTASTAIMKREEGKSLIEVRKIIEDRYKAGFKKPTPTPLPR
ncbi:PCYCGC motif-containing (lipo)protein [Peribacillus deserti]|uniref:Lipoprotein n=1 Tax=Peribacillus deserti TaxID=673318 RepID=A0A2N5M2Z5_9BACI|nr:PCYCGC motif-containing (lipo)protein [Peribacillus deserti]PLT28731.1 hypothetical protein CUU66_17165 [Peribacillus deserti]